MAKQGNAHADSRDLAVVSKRPQSHKVMEGLLLLSALGILVIIFSFFALELHSLSENAIARSRSTPPPSSSSLTPPRVEARVIGSELLLMEIDGVGNPLRTLYASDLSDEIADFTLFAVPQTGYQGFIYVRPIVDGNLPNLKVYPLDVESGTLKAATLSVPADAYLISADETLVGVRDGNTLFLYALEDGALVAEGEISADWRDQLTVGNATLVLNADSCLSLTLQTPLAEEQAIDPFESVCP